MREASIKAIETKYDDNKFRSRLEARWAVFFNEMGIKYLYETEGFTIDGHGYLPDFYFPFLDCWAEVKPKTFTFEEFALCFALGNEGGMSFILLDGQAEIKPFYHLPDYADPTLTCIHAYERYVSTDDWGRVHLGQSALKGRLWFLWGESIDDYNNDLMDSAVRAARQARFEHGA